MDSYIEAQLKEVQALEASLPGYQSSLEMNIQQLSSLNAKKESIQQQIRQLQVLTGELTKINGEVDKLSKSQQVQEATLEKTRQTIESKKKHIQERIRFQEETKKQQEAFAQSPEGILWANFLRDCPNAKSKDRNHSVEWGWYLHQQALGFENQWKAYKDEEFKKSHPGLGFTDYSRHNRFPGFPQLNIVPHESDGSNKVNNGRNNYYRCKDWFENNKKILAGLIAEGAAIAEKQKQAAAKQLEQNKILQQEGEKNTTLFKKEILRQFLEKVGNTLTEEEAEVILGKFYEPEYQKGPKPGHPAYHSSIEQIRKQTYPRISYKFLYDNIFKQDSLLALKVCNRFAEQNQIRVDDAMSLFKEYSNITYALPKPSKPESSLNRVYIRDVNY